jgi:A/G-specific adenine glycosylase
LLFIFPKRDANICNLLNIFVSNQLNFNHIYKKLLKNTQFSDNLKLWYAAHKRDLPWRNTTDPYQIWLSEIMLQQTRVAQGLPYFLKFIDEFPTVFEFAAASESKILKLWQGLGYYSRARNMHFTAKYVVAHYRGQFPSTFKELKKLKGVGEYTASAMASFCFNEPKAVVDGNVYRVLARYFNISLPINSTEGIKYFKNLAAELLDENQPALHNQAIMEFGALQCVPKNPNCSICPLQDQCLAYAVQQVKELPKKIKKLKVKQSYFHYLVLKDASGNYLFEQRKGKGIWENLYQFPMFTSEKEEDEATIRHYFKENLGASIQLPQLYLYNDQPIVHKLTHLHIKASFWIAETLQRLPESITVEELKGKPTSVLVANFIQKFGL